MDLLPKIVNELKQKQQITDALVQQILFSKRLLVDHVEALEDVLDFLHSEIIRVDEQAKPATGSRNSNHGHCKENSIKDAINKELITREIFTGRHIMVLLAAIELVCKTRRLRFAVIPTVILTTGMSTFYAVKKTFVFRNKLVTHELDKLISCIESYGNCIRRNMTYFNEIMVMKQCDLIERQQMERAWDCITSVKEVTVILYEATRKLETLYPLPLKFNLYYEPMEDLHECEYFTNHTTDYNPKQIKDFHNIFAYVQSQYLLRLALSILTKPSITNLNGEIKKNHCIIQQLVDEENVHFEQLSFELANKKCEMDSLIATKVMQQRSGPIAVVRESSLKLSARMMAVASSCHELDMTLQRLNEVQIQSTNSTKELMEVGRNMRTIESALAVCFDDFQRLMLVYNKFLNTRLQQLIEKNEQPQIDGIARKHQQNEEVLCEEISKNRNYEDAKKTDDFFAYIYNESELQIEQTRNALSNAQAQEREILNFEKNLTKGKFKPVLQQLKQHIAPIRHVMLEKEREILSAKGINVNEFLKEEEQLNIHNEAGIEKKTTIISECDTDSQDSSGLSCEYRKKKLRKIKNNNFEEMRQMLARKEAINLMRLDLNETFAPTFVGPEYVHENNIEELLNSNM